MKKITTLFLLLLLTTTTLAAEWTAQKVQGELLRVDHKKKVATIRTDEGKEMPIPFLFLTAEDQARVKKFSEANNQNMKGIFIEAAEGATPFRTRALLVGVNGYNEFSQLSFCKADIEALRDALPQLGIAKENITCLTTGSNFRNNPTMKRVRESILSTLKGLDKDDVVVLAFSGHGVRLDYQDGRASGSYFCPQDASLDDPEKTMISVPWLYEQLNKCPARFKMLLVDACRNRVKVSAEKMAKKNIAGVKSIDGFTKSISAQEKLPKGTVMFLSCDSGEFSRESPKIGHGIFTHFFIEGMRGKADMEHHGDKDGVVSLKELREYVHRRVTDHAFQNGGFRQTPSLYSSWDPELPDFPLVASSLREWPLAFVVHRDNEKGDLFSGVTVKLLRKRGNEPEKCVKTLVTDFAGRCKETLSYKEVEKTDTFSVELQSGAGKKRFSLADFRKKRSWELYCPAPSPARTITSSLQMEIYAGPSLNFLESIGSTPGTVTIPECAEHCFSLTGLTPANMAAYQKELNRLGVTKVMLPWGIKDDALKKYHDFGLLKNVSALALASGYLTDISLLGDLKNLRKLWLDHCDELTTPASLAGLTNLEMLIVTECNGLKNFSAFAGLTNLTSLEVFFCENLTDISDVARMPKLTSLALSMCLRLEVLSAVATLKNLTVLDLSDCEKLTNLSPLAGLKNLTKLSLPPSLTNTQLQDLRDRGVLTNLTSLNLTGCMNLTSISAIADLKNFAVLQLPPSLTNAQLRTLQNQGALANLTELDLRGCEGLTDVSVLANLKKLAKFWPSYSLTNAQLQALRDQDVLTNLSELDLSSCENLTNLFPLANLTNLTKLNVAFCSRLTSVAPLVGLKNLTTLDASCCENLSDISALANLKKLTRLSIYSCDKLTEADARWLKRQLPNCEILR